MPAFITRVELLHASERDYQKLETFMKAALFSDTIMDLSNNISYRLPSNTWYSVSPHDSPSFVLRLAQAAAKKTRKNYSALTVQSDGITFTGLEVATTNEHSTNQ
jgi:hypothetical protein